MSIRLFKSIFIFLIFTVDFTTTIAQDLEVDGKVRIGDVPNNDTTNRFLIQQDDGSIGWRDLSDFTEFQILTRHEDTVFLTNGGYVVLPDASATNEIQQLSVSNSGDTLFFK